MGLGVRFVIRTSHKRGVTNMGISLGVMLGVYTAGVSIPIPSPTIRWAESLTENRSAELI